MADQLLLTHKEIKTLKNILEEKNIDYMMEESYILGEFSYGCHEKIRPIRTHITTKGFVESEMKASLGRYLPINISHAIQFIRIKITLGELKEPGDIVPVLIKDEGMYFWVIGLISRLGGFHLCVKLFGENKWKEGRVLYIGY